MIYKEGVRETKCFGLSFILRSCIKSLKRIADVAQNEDGEDAQDEIYGKDGDPDTCASAKGKKQN